MISLLASFIAMGHHLEADKAAYDGRTLSFEGAFHFTHPMGDFKSTTASLNGLNLKHGSTQLFLDGDVQVILPASDLMQHNISITSKSASCELTPQAPLLFEKFQEIQFKKNVLITSEKGLKAQGGLAVYKNKKITLYPHIPLLYCQLIHEQFILNTETITLQLTGEKPTLSQIFTSGDNEISINPSGHLTCCGPILFDPISNTLSATPQSPLQFTNEEFYLEADQAQIVFPHQELHLQGNIRLISSHFQQKETFAIAEKATYFPQKKVLILNSSSERKVLFWQDGFTLTAPEVHIQQDCETVQGIGDIHFTFNIDEQNYFEQIFSRHI